MHRLRLFQGPQVTGALLILIRFRYDETFIMSSLKAHKVNQYSQMLQMLILN